MAGTHKHKIKYNCVLLAGVGWATRLGLPLELRWQRRNNRETGVDVQNDFLAVADAKTNQTENDSYNNNRCRQ